MSPRHFVLATAGHIDHGKSSLVNILTGTDPDRLPEEKARGITIDLGFACLTLTSATGDEVVIGIVDVPGHEDFIRNMIAGVGSIDLALLVVGADDGWMPQTEEHLQILLYLGVSEMVVAVTKSDLGQTEKVEEQIREQLKNTPFARCPVIKTSALAASGISELKAAILAELLRAPPVSNPDKARLSIDRAFTLRGLGAVVTGTLTGGSLRRGQAALVQPGNLSVRARSLQTYGRDVEVAQPRSRTALNLPDVDLGKTKHSLQRGNVITSVAGESSSTLDVLLQISHRGPGPNLRGIPIKTHSIMDVHHGTSRIPAKVVLFESDLLQPGAEALAQLRLSEPLFAFLGDRFIIRDRSQQHTRAGGVVLDPDARPQSFRAEAQQTFLRARAHRWQEAEVCVESEIARSGFVDIRGLLLKSNFSATEISQSMEHLQSQGRIVRCESIAAEPGAWQRLRDRAIELIDLTHARKPHLPGLDLNDFRSSFPELTSAILEALLVDLCRENFRREGQSLARRTHRTALPPPLLPAAAKIRASLSAKSIDPPARKIIASDQAEQQALQFMITQGSIVEISPEIVFLREDFVLMKDKIRRAIFTRGRATTSQIRQEIGTSRRVLIPFLEYLDRNGVTRRIGDERVLKD